MQVATIVPTRPAKPPSPAAAPFSHTRLTNPARTEVSDASGWAATFTDNAKTVAVRGPARTLSEQAASSLDQFSRTNSNGWGSSPSGGKWYTSGGADSDYFTNGNQGVVNVTTANVSRRLSLSNVLQDVDATVKLRTDKTAYGDNQSPGILLGWQNFENHYIARLDFKPSVIADSFSRATSDGWGSANTDQSWTISGTASDYNTNGSVGVHSVGSVNVSRRAYISSATDFDVKVKVATPVLALGASIAPGLVGRYQDGNNHYIFRARFSPTTGNPVFMVIQKQVAGIITSISSELQVAGLAHVANSFYWLRATAVGTTLTFKIWADGSSEPGSPPVAGNRQYIYYSRRGWRTFNFTQRQYKYVTRYF